MPKESAEAELGQVVIGAIVRSGRSFDEKILEGVGVVEGVAKRLSESRLVTTDSVTAEIIMHIENSRCRISEVTGLYQVPFKITRKTIIQAVQIEIA